MKILAVSDVISGKLYGPSLKDVAGSVDAIVSCGDLPAYYLDYLISSLSKPLLYVCGNHDPYGVRPSRGNVARLESRLRSRFGDGDDEHNFGGTNLDGRVHAVGGTLFAGLEGSRDYNKGVHQYTERQMRGKITRLLPALFWNRLIRGRYLDVLVTHSPPRGIHDGSDRAHQGFGAFLPLIRKYRPRYLLHGHTHIYDQNQNRIFQYHDTTIINCYNYRIIDLDTGEQT